MGKHKKGESEAVRLLRAEIKATLKEPDAEKDPVRRTALNEDLEDLRHELWVARARTDPPGGGCINV